MSPQKSSKQYKSVSRCSTKFYQVKTNDLPSLVYAGQRGQQRRRQRRYRGQNPTWIYIRDLWQSCTSFASGSKFRFYLLLILSTIIGLLIYQWIPTHPEINEQPTTTSSMDTEQCFDEGDVCMIPKIYMSI